MIDFFDEHVQIAVNTIQEICSKIEEIVILRLLAIESYSHGYAFLLYFVLRGTTSKLYRRKKATGCLKFLSQLTNFNACMPILQLIKHSLGKQIESVLIPTLISKLRSGETIKVENCLENSRIYACSFTNYHPKSLNCERRLFIATENCHQFN